MSYQKVILLGRLGKDPEQRSNPSGVIITTFSLATDEKWTKDGQKQSKTSWHNIVTFNRTAEVAGKYLKKGSQVLVEGKLDYQQWETDGVKKYRTVITALSMQMVGNKADNKPDQSSPDYVDNGQPPPPLAEDDFEDDIPF